MMKCGMRNSADTMSQLRHFPEGKDGERGQELEVEKENNNSCLGLGTGLRAVQGRCPGTAAGSCLGKLLGSGNRAGRGAERFWSQTHRDVKATAAEDEERPGKEPEAYAERPRRKYPCSQAVRRAQSWEGKAPFRRRPRLCRAKGEAPGAETGP